MKIVRRNIAYIGAPQSGKTFHNLKLIDTYCSKGQSGCLIYNYSKDADFPDNKYVYVEPLNEGEHLQLLRTKQERSEYKLNPTLDYFRIGYDRKDRSKIYPFEIWNELFTLNGLRVKMKRINNRKTENRFFEAIKDYISNNYVFFDDCLSTLKYFNRYHTDLFNSINHSGKRTNVLELKDVGCDTATIWHDADDVRNELWRYLTDIMIFRCNGVPQLKTIRQKNGWLYETIRLCVDDLMKKPDFTGYHINIKNKVVYDTTLRF